MQNLLTRKQTINTLKKLESLALQKSFVLGDLCFQKQLEFIRDTLDHKIAVTSRRAGKTTACALDLINTAIDFPDSTNVYITLTQKTARKIIWKELKRFNDKYNLGFSFNNTLLEATHTNQSVIFLIGANHEDEIEKLRGLAIKKCYIDECQSFPEYLSSLIEDVIEPSLMDYNGTLILIGTPGPVTSGFFFDAWNSGGWSKHYWTFFDNPFISKKSGLSHELMLQKIIIRRNVTTDHPSIQREYFGKWVNDLTSLVIRATPANFYTDLPKDDYDYIIGGDIGLKDADAIAVLAFSRKNKRAYLIEEKITTKQDITSFSKQLKDLDEEYNAYKIKLDTGGLGAKIAEEIKNRHNIRVEAAEKSRKQEFIELLNDDLRSMRFFIKKDSRFYHDSLKLERKYKDHLKWEESDRFHSDIIHAVLYAWREGRHYLNNPQEKKKLTLDQKAEMYLEKDLQEFSLRQKKPWFKKATDSL